MQHESLLLGISGVIVIGVLAQLVAWWLKSPAILLLLFFGVLVGPLAQIAIGHKLLDPDHLFGELLYPIVSLSVAVVLFEGGLTLKLSEFRQAGSVIRRLVSSGAVVTWLVASLAALWVMGLSWQLSILLGAILVVTGPTVIGPLLRFIRPVGPTGGILKWEGIVIDPIGATLALLVFEAVTAGTLQAAWRPVGIGIAKTLLLGGGVGAASAALLVLLFRRFWVPDSLQNPMTLMLVVAAFNGANLLQEESGLLAVTVLGVALANQPFVPFKHIAEFKENLTVLLVSSLFVLLGARLDAAQMTVIGPRAAIFVLVLLLIARPAAVWVATLHSSLSWRDRLFLASMAPRGIVAAAVSSLFALRLRELDVRDADHLVPLTFVTIIATVAIYGFVTPRLARRLGVSSRGKTGFLIAGANRVAREIAGVLKGLGQEVLLVDTNRENVAAARLAGLPTVQANILSEQVLERLDGTSIGRLLALTPNDEVNALATVHFARNFGRSEIYQLSPAAPQRKQPGAAEKRAVSDELRGRLLFDEDLTYEKLDGLLDEGATPKKTHLTREFGYEEFAARHDGKPALLFLLSQSGDLQVDTVKNPVAPRQGQTVISIATPAAVATAGR